MWGDGPADVLGLTAIAVGGDDHSSSDLVGGCGAEVLPDQFEAEVYGGGCSRGGENPGVLDVQHRGVKSNVRVAGGEVVDVHPVGGGPAALEQAGLGEHNAPEQMPTIRAFLRWASWRASSRNAGGWAWMFSHPMTMTVSALTESAMVPDWLATKPEATSVAGSVGQTWNPYQGSWIARRSTPNTSQGTDSSKIGAG